MARGRKSKYTPERVDIIRKAIAEGKTYKDAYTLAGIGKDAFYEWINNKPEFADIVKKAEQEYNEWYNTTLVQDCKRSLRDLVLGFDYVETKTETAKGKDGKESVTKTTRTTKHVAPNPTAIIFALTNRDPENWENRHLQEIDGKITTDTKTDLSLAAIPDDLLAQVIEKINGTGE